MKYSIILLPLVFCSCGSRPGKATAELQATPPVAQSPQPTDRPATAKDAGITVKDAFLPYTLISDGHLLPQNLHLAGYNPHWLRRQLEKRNLQPRQVLLMTVDGAGKIYLARKEENTSS